MWCKHTDFDIATNVPLILRVPGFTDHPRYSNHISTSFAELVDVFPTLSDYAGISIPPTCPVNPSCRGFGCSSDSTHVRLCTEGQSLRPVVNSCAQGMAQGGSGCNLGKRAAFSVYPHGDWFAKANKYKNSVGYSMTTRYQGKLVDRLTLMHLPALVRLLYRQRLQAWKRVVNKTSIHVRLIAKAVPHQVRSID